MKTIVLIAAVLASAGAEACPNLKVEQAWIREAPPGAMSAAYARLTNTGKKALVVDGARSPDFGGAGLHRTVTDEGGMTRMREAKLELAPGASAALEPGGWHLMLFDPARLLKAGDTVSVTLTCGASSGDFPVLVKASE